MISGLLIDLDGTLVDTSQIEFLQRKRDWRGCVSNLHRTTCFEHVREALRELAAGGTKIAVVTTSVSFYASTALKHHDLPHDVLIAYHDAKPKPAPDPYLKAATLLGFEPTACIGVGDGLPDLQSLKSAGIRALGAAWSPYLSHPNEWDALLRSPKELLKY